MLAIPAKNVYGDFVGIPSVTTGNIIIFSGVGVQGSGFLEPIVLSRLVAGTHAGQLSLQLEWANHSENRSDLELHPKQPNKRHKNLGLLG